MTILIGRLLVVLQDLLININIIINIIASTQSEGGGVSKRLGGRIVYSVTVGFFLPDIILLTRCDHIGEPF